MLVCCCLLVVLICLCGLWCFGLIWVVVCIVRLFRFLFGGYCVVFPCCLLVCLLVPCVGLCLICFCFCLICCCVCLVTCWLLFVWCSC